MILYVAITAISVLILGPAAAAFEIVPPMVGLGLFVTAGFVGAGVVIWGLVTWLRGKNVRSLVSAALGLPCAAALVIPTVMGMQYPAINDVSTDLKDPPVLANGVAYPEGFKTAVVESYPDVKSMVLNQAPAGAFMRALAIAKKQGDWEITRVDEKAMRIEGVATSRLFRFKDDFTIRVRPHGNGSVLDMRSRSRKGKSDYGANGRRIRRFLNFFR